MSLINEALKSIQKKNMKSAQIIPIPVVLLASKRQKILVNNILLIIFAVIFTAATIALIYKIFFVHVKSVNMKPMTNSMLVNQSAILTPMDDVYKASVKINGVSINVRDNITEIIFTLSHQALYALSSDSLSNKLNISIDNAEFVATLPEFSTLKTAIANIEYKNTANSVLLSITLLPKSTIKYLHLNEETKHPELVIAIDNHAEELIGKNSVTSATSSPPVIRPVQVDSNKERYGIAMRDLEKNNIKVTLEKLKEILIEDPSYDAARVSYAALLIENNQLDVAISVLNRGLTIHENYLPYIELKARVYMLTDRSELALELMNEYSPPMAKHPRFYEVMAALYQNTNQHQEAIQIYKNLLSIDATHFEWWVGLGTSLEKTKALDDAEISYKRALMLNTSNAEVNDYLRHRLTKLGERHANTN